MSNLVQNTEERGYRARADRSIQSGRVVSINTKQYTAILDVGMVDAAGNAVYMLDVPFTPQNPPHVHDTIALVRTNSSPYSMVIGGGAQIGGANSSQTVTGVGGTSSGGGSTSSPTSRGQILYSTDGSTWIAATPVVSDTGEIITEDETGYIVVNA